MIGSAGGVYLILIGRSLRCRFHILKSHWNRTEIYGSMWVYPTKMGYNVYKISKPTKCGKKTKKDGKIQDDVYFPSPGGID